MSGLSTLCPIAHVPPPFVFALYFPGYVLDLTLLGLADSSCFSQVAPPITLIPFLASGSMLLTVRCPMEFGDSTSWSSWTCPLGPDSTSGSVAHPTPASY